MIRHTSELCTWNLFRQMSQWNFNQYGAWNLPEQLSELISEYTSHEFCQTRCHNTIYVRIHVRIHYQNTLSGLYYTYIYICYNWHQPTTCQIMCQSICQDRWQSSCVSQYVSGYMSNYRSEILHVRVYVRNVLAEYRIIMSMSCQSFCQDKNVRPAYFTMSE